MRRRLANTSGASAGVCIRPGVATSPTTGLASSTSGAACIAAANCLPCLVSTSRVARSPAAADGPVCCTSLCNGLARSVTGTPSGPSAAVGPSGHANKVAIAGLCPAVCIKDLAVCQSPSTSTEDALTIRSRRGGSFCSRNAASVIAGGGAGVSCVSSSVPGVGGPTSIRQASAAFGRTASSSASDSAGDSVS